MPKELSTILPPVDLEGAYTLYFDGAFRRKMCKAAGGILVHDTQGGVFNRLGRVLEGIKSNNEAQYATLVMGLKLCLEHGVRRLNVKGDAMLLIKQNQGTWACKN